METRSGDGGARGDRLRRLLLATAFLALTGMVVVACVDAMAGGPAVDPNTMLVRGRLNPRDIITQSPRFSWTPPAGGTQTNWQIQIDSDPNYQSPLWFWDSGALDKGGLGGDTNVPYAVTRVPTGNNSGVVLPIDTRPHLIYWRLRVQMDNSPTWDDDLTNFSYGTFKMNQHPLPPADLTAVVDSNPGLIPSTAGFPPLNGSPREFFADPGGSDSNPGTSNSPFRTIRKGITVLRPGDTLTLRAGTYGENVEIRTGTIVNGEPGNPITIRTDPQSGSPAVIRGVAAGNQPFAPLRFIGSSGRVKYWTIDRVRLSGGSVAFGAFINNAEHITLRNISFTSTFNSAATGVQLIGGGDGNRILDSTFDKNMFDHIDVANSQHVEVRNNLFENFRQHSAIQVHVAGSGQAIIADNIFRHGTPTAGAVALYLSSDGAIVRNNLIYDVSPPPQGVAPGVQILRSGKAIIENNTIVACESGVLWGQYTGFSTVRNNIFINNGTALNFHLATGGQSPPDQHTASRGAVIDHNWLFNNGTDLELAYPLEDSDPVFGVTMFDNCPSYTRIGGIWQQDPVQTCDPDPALVNPGSEDFRLSAGSPAIDAGDPNFPVPIGGGSARDVGALEFGAGSPPYQYQAKVFLGDSTPRFTWQLNDVDNKLNAMLPADFPDLQVQFGFELEVDPLPTFDSVNGNRPFFSSGATISATEGYTIPDAYAFPPGEYYVRVRQVDDSAQDRSGLGQWSIGGFRIRVASEPQAPSLIQLSPGDGDLGVDPNTTVSGTVVDFGAGVNSNTIQVNLGVNNPSAPTAVTPQITQIGPSEYQFSFDLGAVPGVTISSGDVIHVRVQADDLDMATGPNSLDQTYSFTIRDTQAPADPTGLMVVP